MSPPRPNTGAVRAALAHRPRRRPAAPPPRRALAMGPRRRAELADDLFARLLGDLGDDATAIAVTATQEALRRADWSRDGATFVWVRVPDAGWVVVPVAANCEADAPALAAVALAWFRVDAPLREAAGRVRAALADLARRRDADARDAAGHVFIVHVAPPWPGFHPRHAAAARRALAGPLFAERPEETRP